MDKESDIESKYHRLATEYSKVRSQATVLKKAVLDEQTKNGELNELVKRFEQTLRKRDQEMESLTFRNEQLTKRILVLQQELQTSSNGKKGKHKIVEVSNNTDMGILNEELQQKIIENAQLYNTIADKDTEILENKEKLDNLEEMVADLQKELENRESLYQEIKDKHAKEMKDLEKILADLSNTKQEKKIATKEAEDKAKFWKAEAERWKAECEVLKSKPSANEKLTKYYESQLSQILETNAMLQSETKTISADNTALKCRLENITEEYGKLKDSLETSREDLITTNNNYKSQLDAMTEHLAAQNEKITEQTDEIQMLKHKLALKK